MFILSDLSYTVYDLVLLFGFLIAAQRFCLLQPSVMFYVEQLYTYSYFK